MYGENISAVRVSSKNKLRFDRQIRWLIRRQPRHAARRAPPPNDFIIEHIKRLYWYSSDRLQLITLEGVSDAISAVHNYVVLGCVRRRLPQLRALAAPCWSAAVLRAAATLITSRGADVTTLATLQYDRNLNELYVGPGTYSLPSLWSRAGLGSAINKLRGASASN